MSLLGYATMLFSEYPLKENIYVPLLLESVFMLTIFRKYDRIEILSHIDWQ